MEQSTSFILNIIGIAFLIGFGILGFTSFAERERRATRISFTIAIIGSGIFFLVALLTLTVKVILITLLLTVLAVTSILFLLSIGEVDVGDDIPNKRFDERDVIFARARLQPGSPEYQSYYHKNPENKKRDDQTRTKPGLLSLKSKFANPFLFASAVGSSTLTDVLRNALDGPVAENQTTLPIEDMTRYLKNLTLYFGALEVGITPLMPYHVYSHVGRGIGVYGSPIPIKHRFALAFTVEMNFQMIGTAPTAPTVMESVKQYVESARVAVQLASVIQTLGYSARAHIDGNYQVIAPLVARDAGLGAIGRMGILMTQRQGPRVRLGVVTTDLELLPDQRYADASVIDFCNICTKCALNCPSKSIPFGERQRVDGALRWKIDPDTCFRYWNVIGTDCGRCLAVCPYSHPNTLLHNLIRKGISRSGFFRRAALWLDNIFYGEMPSQRDAPQWTEIS